MDKWNKDGMDSYTGISAQRRNRRRPAEGSEGPKEPEKPAVPAETEASAEPATPAEPAVSVKADPAIEPIVTMEPIREEEPAASAEHDVTAEPDPEKPEVSAEPEAPAVSAEPAEPAVPAEPETPAKTDIPAEPPVTLGADSRVPAEARRMAAEPYGPGGSALEPTGPGPRVTGTRPVRPGETRPTQRPRTDRPPQRPGTGPERRPDGRSAGRPGGRPAETQRTSMHVGYAPGRMTDADTRQIPSERAVRESLQGQNARAYLEKRNHPFRDDNDGRNPPPETGSKGLRVIVIILVLIGLVLSGVMLIKGFGKGGGKKTREAPQVISYEAPVTTGLIAPVDLTFSAVTAKDVEGIRLRAEGDVDLDTTAYLGDNADANHWMIKMHVETGFTGTVTLQVRRGEAEGWYDTEYTTEVDVSTTPGVEIKEEPVETEPADGEGENAGNAGEGQPEGTGGEGTENTADGTDPEETEEPEDENSVVVGYVEDIPMGDLKTPEPATPTPEPTPVPTETPPLEAVAADEADPSIITNVTVWSSVTKKEKNYARPAKETVQMPDADHYTPGQFGVMTFRGDNFRRNAATGAMSGTPVKLTQLWKVEGGSARGVNQTYYGYGWTGQPVIARWSTEIKEKTNIEAEKKERKALKEVIIAGLDGNIRFLDLADGKFTRSSIKLGYAMRGTPSLHSGGYPFMSVGQYARKMKNKTGMIGLRQYNLYNLEPTKVIDGLDGKYHRPENDIGSFETSALFDHVSDTMIAVGTNGALYVESLSSTFDYNLGVMKISPATVMMTNKVKGVKNKALLAVESSPAAYDRYVFYADMGGVLRCVDTNTMQPVWAVSTGDSVMAAVAMDLTEARELNLYTANMLNNRKKGNSDIQIRRYDALSGREIWCTDIGVYKGKKDKDDVGAKASPIIGQNGLNDYVYFTVTGLSDDGRDRLRLTGGEQSALIAMEKETGNVVWAFGMKSRSESSPIAVYDKKGNGWIVQCEQDGLMHLLNGLTGTLVDTFDLEAQVEASPCAYNNVVVIGTTGKKTAFIYAIELKIEQEEEAVSVTPAEEQAAAENTEDAETEYADDTETEYQDDAEPERDIQPAELTEVENWEDEYGDEYDNEESETLG